MANNKKWTKEEEEILVQAIQTNPHNISGSMVIENAFDKLNSNIDDAARQDDLAPYCEDGERRMFCDRRGRCSSCAGGI